MDFFWQSIQTKSYWKYALFTTDARKTFFAVLGGFWLFIEILDYFKIFSKDDFPSYSFIVLLFISLLIVVISRRPINKILFKLPGKDILIEVRIGNLFGVKGQKIISSNTTFDTNIANGIISPNSVQGQFTNKYYPQNVDQLDSLLESALINLPFETISKEKGKVKKYSLGTTITIRQGPEIFYLLAMSSLNYHNTAETTVENVLYALDQLWEHISTTGEKETIVLPLIGTGKGRLTISRKKLITNIVQSFIKASENRIFCSKLTIVIHPRDVEHFGINLFEVKDLLGNYFP